MQKTKDKIIKLDYYNKELVATRNKLYELIDQKKSFCDSEVVAASRKLDELLLSQMIISNVRKVN